MKLLSVGLTGTADEVRIRLQHDCTALINEGFSVAVDQIHKGNYTFLGCNIVDGEISFRNYERVKNVIKHYVAKILTDQVVAREEKILIRKIIEQNYYYFSDDERNALYENTLGLLDGLCPMTNFNQENRRKFIYSNLLEYLDTHHELVLDGFIQFRLKDYRQKLSETVDRAVDDFMMELEYQEFIKVLKYFVDVQEPRVEEVHVLVNHAGVYRILDHDGKVISNQYLEGFSPKSGEEINYEDLLISALISIAPYNIMLHSDCPAKEHDVVETLKNVFDGRVVICHGCDICRLWR